jgi:integrase
MPRGALALSNSPRRLAASGKRQPPEAWRAEVDRFVCEKGRRDEVGETWLKRIRWELDRFPQLMVRVGQKVEVSSPKDVTVDCLHALRDGLPWEPSSIALHFQALRQFLRWGDNPLAAEKNAWRLPSAAPIHRRWLTREQLLTLYQSARGVEKVVIALEGFNGLRRIEVLRLRTKDVLLDQECLRVLGKGRHGGKWRNIPMAGEVRRVLAPWIEGHGPEEHVVPYSLSGVDLVLQRAARRANFPGAGLKVSHHDLRRTFGRLANASGIDLVALQGLFGHASPELSAHYIGLDVDSLRTALDRLGTFIGQVRPPGRGTPSAGRYRTRA